MSDFVAAQYAVDEISKMLNEEDVFGFIHHMEGKLNPEDRIEYIGLNKTYNPITITMGGGYSLGDWADFPILKNNKPYMVKSNGYADYELSGTDYTKKADGETASDVANTSYDGGAFSWLQKIYKKEYTIGGDRYVKFSFVKRDGFEAVGFIDSDDKELEGIWLPMFFGNIDGNGKMLTISGTQPDYGKTTAEQKTAIDEFNNKRGKFLGGPAINTIRDLLFLWGKTADLQDKYGYGNCNGYDSTLSPTYGVLANAVVGGGQFYGTGADDKKHLNKILHSIVLGSYQQWQRDPYTQSVNGRVYVSPNYKYDISTPATTYKDTGIQLESTGGWVYPHKYAIVDGFGAIPVQPYKGTTATGDCDGFYMNDTITAVALRFGFCSFDLIDGVGTLILNSASTYAHWDIGASVLLLPPVGASPDAA